MLDHEAVSIPVCPNARVSIPALELISIAQLEFAEIKTHRHGKDHPVLPRSPALERLCADVQVVRRKRNVLTESKSKPNTDALIDRMSDVAPDPQRANNVEIDRVDDRRRQLHFRPLLVVVVRLRLRIRDHKEAHDAQSVDQKFLSHPLVLLCGGSTVKEVNATTTLSPTCNRMARHQKRTAFLNHTFHRVAADYTRQRKSCNP